jgi:hypothetical protein
VREGGFAKWIFHLGNLGCQGFAGEGGSEDRRFRWDLAGTLRGGQNRRSLVREAPSGPLNIKYSLLEHYDLIKYVVDGPNLNITQKFRRTPLPARSSSNTCTLGSQVEGSSNIEGGGEDNGTTCSIPTLKDSALRHHRRYHMAVPKADRKKADHHLACLRADRHLACLRADRHLACLRADRHLACLRVDRHLACLRADRHLACLRTDRHLACLLTGADHHLVCFWNTGGLEHEVEHSSPQ